MNTDTTIPTTPVTTRVATTVPGAPTRARRNVERRDFGDVIVNLFNDDLPLPMPLRHMYAIGHTPVRINTVALQGAPVRPQRPVTNIQHQHGVNNVVRHLFDDDVLTEDEGDS
jgi:hypothetical protein